MYSFTAEEADQIIGRFGRVFWEGLGEKLSTCSERWGLSGLELLHSFSANCVFTGESSLFGKAVLKLGPPERERATEAKALEEYNGKLFCRLFAADAAEGALLEERLLPGTPLRDEPSLDKRMSVFSGLVAGLHIAPADAEAYPSYLGWVTRIARYMREREGNRRLCGHMQKAEKLCKALWDTYPRRVLLHGDLHHDNILLEQNGTYRIIDPKGVIGDPVFELPRFILNEVGDIITPDTYRRMNTIIISLAERLGVPEADLRQLFYIETAMAESWNVESRLAPSLEHVELAEALLMEAGE
ncbi:aminoglycoside phosphotransferase family protein [Paenibacillus mesotrionivorans]|uniref:Aminoglycoside phosphotransferase family protein n=1 Tax=Paenibacillus mesotrionivorans TaxID=3160968 RepID=A0ACC7NZV6_9BACL